MPRPPEQAKTDRVSHVCGCIDRTLLVVAAHAIVFVCAVVTLFALAQGTPWLVGWLPDPQVSMVVLIGDGALSRQRVTAGPRTAALKLGAGLSTWVLNVWSAVASGGLAAVLLQAIAPGLLIRLMHAAPAYRLLACACQFRDRHASTRRKVDE